MFCRRAVVRPLLARPLLVQSAELSRRGPSLPKRLPCRQYSDGDTGDSKTGHITTTPQEGIIFFNNLLPTNLQWLFRLTSRFDTKSLLLSEERPEDNLGVTYPAQLFKDATKDGKVGEVEVVEILPRLAEGGAFLKFRHDETVDSKAVASAVRDYLKTHRAGTWWNPFATVRANVVLGKPWLEDLSRYPFRRLRVEFLPTEPGAEAAELSQEQLYSYFRAFGKLADIKVQPSDSKVLPRYAYLDFDHMRKAIMAKNCMHGYVVNSAEGGGKGGTVLRLTYEKKQRSGWIKDWIFGHPRIVIPLIAALIAGISIAIFDPVRTLSIKAHITRTFHVEDNVLWRWFRRQSEDLLNRVRQFGGDAQARSTMSVVWQDRRTEIDQIKSWLMETADTFIIVQGPRGSGKRELVLDHALQHKREAHKVLIVDCKPLQEARGDSATIAAAAAQVGYRPVFSWMNSVSGLMDLASQSLTGAKAGFSETLENQLVKIWNKTSSALKSVALEGRRRDDADANLSDDEFLEAHPERRPVVVIEHFLHRNSEPGAALIYDKIAEWAASLTTSNIAHVIFLTNDISYSKSLSKALPDRVFRQISLGDCSPEVAKRYVINHLDFDAQPTKVPEDSDGNDEKSLTPSQKRKDLQELDGVIEKIGGRLTDLEFLARRIKTGETPMKAVSEIIQQSSSEILKIFLLPSSGENREWTVLQAWTLIQGLASSESLRYNEVLLNDAFKTEGDRALTALEQAELIAVDSYNGRPYSIKPGRPIYQPAFQRLINDNVLKAKLDLAVLGDAIGTENKSIEKFELELKLLGELPRQPTELQDRIHWLLKKIATSQRHIEDLEKQSAGLKKILQTEF